ncbi:MAG: TPM domain-containing protein [Oscillospiraceae bacterium]|nr:TPM domain-containing protein [Oscillospiraceae bacterium]
MKKLMIFLLTLCLCLSVVCAAGVPVTEADKTLMDEANLLTDVQERVLRNKLSTISEKWDARISVVTMASLNEQNIEEYANELFDTYDYGYGSTNSGVLLVVVMDVREFWILSNGLAGDAIGYYEIGEITDALIEPLSDGDYEAAFDLFADMCDDYLAIYDRGEPFDWQHWLFVGAIIGLIISGIVVLVFRGQLKSVRSQSGADAYIRGGSLQLTQMGDFFMYRNVTKTPIPQNNSSGGGHHGGGGGGSRHGGGGRF